jgi:glycerophosphoryl diester phosphodiesterase
VTLLADPDARLVIGHRGCAAIRPENTLVSLTPAVEETADGVAVVLHDSTLDRTTSGKGPVARHTLAELRDTDAGARFSPDGGRTFPFRDGGIRIPTLQQVLEELPDTLPLLIELKTVSAAKETARLLKWRGAESRAVVDSMLPDAVHALGDSPVRRGATRAGAKRLLFRLMSGRTSHELEFDALCVPPFYRGIPVPLKRFAAVTRRARKAMHVWTINDPDYASRLWSWGVNGIVTDHPARILSALASD